MSTPPPPPGTRASRVTLGTRFRKALFAPPRAMHVLLLVICLILGFALVTQVRAQRMDPLDSLSEEDLVVLLSELSTQEDSLRQERNSLQQQVQELESAATEQEAAAEAARRTLEQARINAGLVAVRGPGVLVRVTDPTSRLASTEFVMTLGELRNAGAEAVELNGVRLTTRSSFTSSDSSTVYVDGQPMSAPYDWKIIGDPDTISTALEIQAGAAAQMRAKGAQVSIVEAEDVLIESTAAPLEPRFASVEGSE